MLPSRPFISGRAARANAVNEYDEIDCASRYAFRLTSGSDLPISGENATQ